LRRRAIGVSGLNSTNANVSYTAAQTAAIIAGGLGVSAAETYTVTENFSNGDDLVYQSGLLVQQKTVNADGSYDIAYTNVTGQSYGSDEAIYNDAGTKVATAYNYLTGAGGLTLSGSDLTVSAGASELGGQLASATGGDAFALNPNASETVSASGTTDDTFVFTPSSGQDALNGFVATGASHDMLQFSLGDFSYLNAGMSQAQDLAAVIAHGAITQSGSNTLITDTQGDTLTLNAISKTTLTAQPADFVFK